MKKKHSVFYFFALITASFLFITGCNDDDFHEHKYEKPGIKSSKLTSSDLQKYPNAIAVIGKVKKKIFTPLDVTTNKVVIDSLNNFTIETDEILLLEYANLHSLTFPIHRNEPNGLLENLVLSYQNNGTYKAKILQYNLTEQEKVDLASNNLKTISNPIVTLPINFDTNLVVNACEVVTETVYFYCSSGEHSYSTGTAQLCEFWAPGSNGFPPRMATKTTVKCIDEGGSGGDSNTDPNYDPSGGGGGDGTNNNYPVDYPTPETDPSEYEEGISTPVKPKLDAPQKTPCTDLNSKSVDSNFLQKMQELALDANGSAEAGIVTFKNNPAYGQKKYGAPDSNGNSAVKLEWETNRNNEVTGFMHCHLNTLNPALKTNTVFSLSDLVAFAELIQYSTVDVSEFAMYVTTNRGTFALKLTDKQAIIDLANYIVNDTEGNVLDDFENKVKWNDSKNKQIKGLLNFLNKSGFGTGIELYESDSSFKNWKKKSLDTNGNIQTTDC